MTALAAAPTLDDVRAWPATVGVNRACKALGISRSWGYQLVAQNEFPVRVLKLGGTRPRVVTAELIRLLEADPGATP